MNEKKNALAVIASKAREGSRYIGAKAAAAGAALTMVAGSAMAGGGSTPGAAIAAELQGGGAEMGLVFAAVAVLLGLLLVWTYIKRSAR